jgi:hypothetical protein
MRQAGKSPEFFHRGISEFKKEIFDNVPCPRAGRAVPYHQSDFAKEWHFQ